MNRFLQTFSLFAIMIISGCAHTHYRVYVYNGTPAKVTEAKVTVATGELLSFGTIGSSVDKGMWPVIGPLGKEASVEWLDANSKKKSAKTPLIINSSDDSVIFLINSNDSVTVKTGRKLYGYREPR